MRVTPQRLLALTVAAGFGGSIGAGCGQSSSVHVRLEAPATSELTPLDDRLANLTLVVQGDGIATQIQTVAVADRGEPLALGEVPIAEGMQVTVIASSAGGRMIGYGRGVALLDVVLGSQAEVTVRVRRPFAYLAGTGGLDSLDATLDSSQAYRATLGGVGAATAVAVTPDGGDVVVASGTQILLVSTATHMPSGQAVDVGGGVTDLAFSPDGRMLVVAHDNGNGVTLIDVGGLRAGAAQPVHVAVGATAAVAVSTTTAYALTGAWDDAGCAPSSIVPIDLATGAPGTAVLADRAVSDLAIEPRSGTLLVALPCDSKVGVLGGAGGEPALTQFFDVPEPTTLAISSGRIWALGRVNVQGGSHLVLASVGLDGSSPAVLDLGVPEERALSNDFNEPGQGAEQRIQADSLRGLDLAVLPDGSRVAILQRAFYHADEAGDPVFPFDSVIPAIDITTYEYQLLDATTGTALQRLRTRCEITFTQNSFLNDFSCTKAAGQDLAASPFVPRRVAVLFGDR